MLNGKVTFTPSSLVLEVNRQSVKGFTAGCDPDLGQGTRYTINFRGEGNGMKLTQMSFFAPKTATTLNDDNLMAFLENMREVLQTKQASARDK